MEKNFKGKKLAKSLASMVVSVDRLSIIITMWIHLGHVEKSLENESQERP